MLPLVVIAPDIDPAGGISIDRRCADWIERAGGRTRVAEPDESEPLRRAGGLLLCGGFFDIPPDWYGEAPPARSGAGSRSTWPARGSGAAWRCSESAVASN